MIQTHRLFSYLFCVVALPNFLVAPPSHATPLQYEPSTKIDGAATGGKLTMPDDNLAQKLIDASGLGRLLTQIPDAIEQGFTAGSLSDDYPGVTKDQLAGQLGRAFSQQRMLATVNDSLSSDLTAETMSAALMFLQSPLGRSIVEQEVERSGTSHNIDVSKYGENLSASPFRQKRKQVLSELEQAWDITEISVDMLIDMQIAMSIAMMPSMPNGLQTDVVELSKRIEDQRPTLLAHYQEDTLNTLFYVYAKLTVEEIREYIAFATSPHGQHYVSAMNRAQKKAMMEGSYLWGRELGIALADSQGVSL